MIFSCNTEEWAFHLLKIIRFQFAVSIASLKNIDVILYFIYNLVHNVICLFNLHSINMVIGGKRIQIVLNVSLAWTFYNKFSDLANGIFF